MKRVRFSITLIVIVVVTVGSVLLTLLWATDWYNMNAQQLGRFSPGELGSALNFAILIVTALAVLFAALAYLNTAQQLEELRIDQQVQLVDRMLTSALKDYQRRVDGPSKEQYFRLSLNDLDDSGVSSDPVDVERRWSHFRTANYQIKPITYWCKWLVEAGYLNDSRLSAALTAEAFRVLSALSSDAHVYLILAYDLKIHDVIGTKAGYTRTIIDHVPIYSFLEAFAPVELAQCREGNQGQMKSITNFIEKTRWFETQEASKRFFAE